MGRPLFASDRCKCCAWAWHGLDRQALTILNVHHGLKIIDSPEDWFVPLTASQPYPHTPYEAATDFASLFPRQLTAAYPDAEIVLVDSDFGKWLREPVLFVVIPTRF
ncbi:hypothetical protein HDU84_007438 [Entophlyctis sp. JEL0112]|nr:hypothetical protein HDU84_007438 [Entophlyctis sp. JEL0112]